MGRTPVWCHHRALSVHLGLFSAHYRRNLLACWVNIGNLRTAKYLANNFVRSVFFSRDVSWACHTKLGAVVSGITSFLSVITSQSRWFLMILLSVILFLSSGLYDGSCASTDSVNYTFRVVGIKRRSLWGGIFMEGSLFDCLVCQLVYSDLLDLGSWCEPGRVTLPEPYPAPQEVAQTACRSWIICSVLISLPLR